MRRSLLLFMFILLTGCGGLFETKLPASSIYVLAPAPRAATDAARVEVDLAIAFPQAAPGLDTDRIAVVRGRELNYFTAVRWGANMPQVVQALLIGSFGEQGLFRSVTAEDAAIATTHVLDLEVTHFEAEYKEGARLPVAKVAFIGRLIRVRDRKLIQTMPYAAEIPAADHHMNAMAAAFEAAAQQVAMKLAQNTAIALANPARE